MQSLYAASTSSSNSVTGSVNGSNSIGNTVGNDGGAVVIGFLNSPPISLNNWDNLLGGGGTRTGSSKNSGIGNSNGWGGLANLFGNGNGNQNGNGGGIGNGNNNGNRNGETVQRPNQ